MKEYIPKEPTFNPIPAPGYKSFNIPDRIWCRLPKPKSDLTWADMRAIKDLCYEDIKPYILQGDDWNWTPHNIRIREEVNEELRKKFGSKLIRYAVTYLLALKIAD